MRQSDQWQGFATWPRRVQVFKLAGYWVWCCPCCGCFEHFHRVAAPWVLAAHGGQQHAALYHDHDQRRVESVG